MAVTFAITDRELFTLGNKMGVVGLATATGTTTDNGDTFSAGSIGLQTIQHLSVASAVDSTTNPENALVACPIKLSGGTWKIVFATAAVTPTLATPLGVLTDGTTVTDYNFRFFAISDRA